MSRAALMARKLAAARGTPPAGPRAKTDECPESRRKQRDRGKRVPKFEKASKSVLQDSLSCLDMPRETSGGYGAGAHLFPSRTEKLSPAAAMILRESVVK